MIKRVILFCLAAIFFSGHGYCMGSRPPEAPPDLEMGKRLFEEHCAGCHGENGVGQDPQRRGGGWDASGVPIAPALNGTAHTWHHSPRFLFEYVSKGSRVRKSPMPSFAGTLDRREILSVIAYLQILWPERIRENYFRKYK